MAKQLSPKQKVLRSQCDAIMLAEAYALRKLGKDYPNIETTLIQKGILDHNGKPYQNARISKAVITHDPSMRVRAARTPKVSKKKVTKKQKRSYVKNKTNNSNISSVISAMEKVGIAPEQILKTIKAL
jgi:hypothetical protein